MTDPLGTPGPTSHVYYSQRLRLHYVDWGNSEAPPMLLVHGGRDHCRNWDWVAQHFYRDYHIIAPDLRGHGDSQWNLGGSYTIPEYVYDIAQLVHQKNFTPVTILAHSLGGMISLHYTGIYPEFVKKLVVIEGTGTPPERLAARAALPPERRLDDWTQALRKLSGRTATSPTPATPFAVTEAAAGWKCWANCAKTTPSPYKSWTSAWRTATKWMPSSSNWPGR